MRLLLCPDGKDGLISPVLSVSCEYKTMTHFGDTVEIETEIVKYNGIKLELSYTVRDKETGEVRCLGKSSHCFLDREGRPVSLKEAGTNTIRAFRKKVLNKYYNPDFLLTKKSGFLYYKCTKTHSTLDTQ